MAEGRLVSWVVGIQKGRHIKIYVNFIKCLRRIKTTNTHIRMHTITHTHTYTQILEYVSETCKCNANRRENSAADKRQLHLRIRIRNLGAVSRSVYAACAWRYIFKFQAQHKTCALSFSCQLCSKLMLIVLELTRPRPAHDPPMGFSKCAVMRVFSSVRGKLFGM